MIEVRYIYDRDDLPVNEYTLNNGKYQLSVINLGAAVTKIIVPNKNDKLENITLRYYDYKFYKENRYLLGCLIDYDRFSADEPSALNYYFTCETDKDALTFTYRNGEAYIIIKYTLVENYLSIVYDNNMNLNLSQALFFNLTGNLKDDITGHVIKIGGKPINLHEEIARFKHFNAGTDTELVSLNLPDNGIKIGIDAPCNSGDVSFGSYFNGEFFLNKKTAAQKYVGLGVVIGGPKKNKSTFITF